MPSHSLDRLDTIAYRAASPTDADPAIASQSTRSEPGRFNTSAFGALYLAGAPETAIDELRRTVQRRGSRLTDAHPCSLYSMRIVVGALLDFTDSKVRHDWSLSLSDLANDDMGQCREIADTARRRNVQAIRWPSATGSGNCLAVFVEGSDSTVAKIVNRLDLSCDMLAALEDADTPERIARLLSHMTMAGSPDR